MKDSRPLAKTFGLLLITILKDQNLPSARGDSAYMVTYYYILASLFFFFPREISLEIK